jgi:threonine/homoserine/homoserine lactone efflux protein
MPSAGSFSFFLAASLLLLFTPGPAVLYIVTRAVDQGRLAGVVSALGITVGTLVHVAAAAVGLSALLVSSQTAFTVLKYGGAAYLVYLGARKLLDKEAAVQPSAGPQPLRQAFYQGIWVNVLNPKTGIFFLAFLPQFVDVSRGAPGRQVALLGLCFGVLGLASDSLYALLAGSIGGWLKSSRSFAKVQRYVAGSVYIGLGVATAVAGTRRK